MKPNIILAILLLAFIIVSMTSCGARKTSKSVIKVEESIKEQSSAIDTTKIFKNQSSDENVKRDVKTESSGTETTEIETVTPIDPSKPSSFVDEKGNKKELNNSSWQKKKTTKSNREITTDNTNIAKSEKALEIQQNGVSEANNKESNKLESEFKKETFKWYLSWWWLLLLLIPFGWWLYKRYKPKIPFLE